MDDWGNALAFLAIFAVAVVAYGALIRHTGDAGLLPVPGLPEVGVDASGHDACAFVDDAFHEDDGGLDSLPRVAARRARGDCAGSGMTR